MADRAFPPAQFQTFDEKSDPRTVAPRLKALRTAIAEAGVTGFLVPRADRHRGESVPPSEARLAFISGFTGSAGLALVGRKKAALLVDSRYTIQAPAQTDTNHFDVHEAPPATVSNIVATYVPRGGAIGYDPWLHTPGEIAEWTAKLTGKATLVAVENLIDRVWTDRPGAPVSPIEFLGHNRAGRTAPDKIADLQQSLATEGADAAVLTLPESVCWLFNMRGRDVPNTPFVLGFALIPRRGAPTLFLDPAKITPEIKSALDGIATLAPTANLPKALAKLGATKKTVLLDPASAPLAIASTLREAGATVLERRDPVLLPKSRKNDAELGGMREAQRLDAVALAKFLHWFDGAIATQPLTEIDIVSALEAFRREDPSCVDASFDTIAGSGPNGAIVHYRVSEKTNRTLQPGDLMLLDSGAQYLSGTTDITRTLWTGSATPEQRDRFTRVLKGMIAISVARFPKNTSGAQIDILARQFLWADGVTYSHGTGHGVGAFLGVHEGPVGISSRYPLPLEVGNVLSNEPGFYKAGEYGIRIENLIAVVDSPTHLGFREFQTLTLTPIDRRLIDPQLLTPAERDWLDAYHLRIRQEIGPLVAGEVKTWLEQATAPLKELSL